MHNNQSNDEETIDLENETIQDDNEELLVFEDTDDQNAELSKDAKLKKLRSELLETKKQRDEYLASLQRARADYINLQKSEETKRKDLSKTLKIGLVEDLFTTLDAFDGAMANKAAWDAVDAKWRVGVEYIYQNLIKTLEDWGVTKIEALGKPFDHAYHEPASHEESSEYPPDTVIKVIQTGYQMQEFVIRPSKVVVSK